MKRLLKILAVIGLILLPFLLSAVFIALGHPDKDGRYSLTGEATKTPDEIQKLRCELKQQAIDATIHQLAVEIPQDGGSGCAPTDLAQMGSVTYYKVSVKTPAAFYNAVNGKAFNEGYGIQCVAGFKEFMYSLSGRIVATNTGGASGYAKQQGQIEPLGFKWHGGSAGLQDGDWGIFGGGSYGHVAMYYSGQWFGQNQGAADQYVGNAFNLMSISSSNLIGYYRPNIYVKKPSSPPVAGRTTTPAKPSTSSATNTKSYTVEGGDTLGQIILDQRWSSGAGLWGTNGDANRTARSNGIMDANLIFPGQTIRKPQ